MVFMKRYQKFPVFDGWLKLIFNIKDVGKNKTIEFKCANIVHVCIECIHFGVPRRRELK